MSSHSRSKVHEMSRSKDDLSSYRSSPYSTKMKSEIDSRKRSSYSSREVGRGEMSSKHKDISYASKSSASSSRRSLDERKESYVHSSERREAVQSKRNRDEYISNSSRDIYPKGAREKEYRYFETKERNLYPPKEKDYYPPSRGTGSDSFSRGRGSYSSRGSGAFSSRGSGAFSSRGSGAFSSRGGGAFSSRGSGSFLSRGSGSFSSRGSREAYPMRDSYGSNRGSYGPARGGRDSYSQRGGSYGANRGGRESYSSRGGFGSLRGGKEFQSGRGRDSYSMRGSRGLRHSNFRGSQRGGRSDHYLSELMPRAQYELTKKLVASVLQDSDGHGHYRDEKQYRMRDFKQDSRDFYRESSDRPYKEVHRPFTHSSAFNQSDKMITARMRPSAHYDKERFLYSERPKMKVRDKFREVTKRTHHDEHDTHDDSEHDLGPPKKQQRYEKADKYREYEDEKRARSYSPKRKMKGEVVRESEERGEKKKERSGKESSRHVKKKKRSKSTEDVDELEEEEEKVKVKRRFTPEDEEEDEEEEEEEYVEEKKDVMRGRKRSPSGMQVTIRSDGERAVNSDRNVKSRLSGKAFVDLQCPHCPGQRSFSLKKYRHHLDSVGHRKKIENLTYKHSLVLRRIRLQQRTEQRENEEKWEKDKPDLFKTTVSKYCHVCKLAFKCLPEDNSAEGIAEHNESKLHKVQQRCLYPRCIKCRMSFPSRFVYEYHVASVRHLRMQCAENGQDGSNDGQQRDEAQKGEEVDFNNYITMDSVGDDQQEELGSEQDEIKGKLEDIEKAEQDAKEGEDEDDEEEEEEREGEEASSLVGEEGEPFEVEVEDEGEHEDHEEEMKEEAETCGKNYIVAIEAVYCKLCHKAIRTDTVIGEKAINRHCSSADHFHNYDYLVSGAYMEEQGENLDEEELERTVGNEEEEEEREEIGEEEEEEEMHLGESEQEEPEEENEEIEEAKANGN